MIDTQYYEWGSSEPRLLMRRSTDLGHHIFSNGEWHWTDRIMSYMAKGDDYIDTIDTESAKEKYPEAFN